MAAALLSAMVAGVVAFGGACDGGGLVHTFGAYAYDADKKCLNAAALLDVVEGADPGRCAQVRCWVNPAGDAFVTDQACDAPLDLTESMAGACEPALEAFKTSCFCANTASCGGGGAGGS